MRYRNLQSCVNDLEKHGMLVRIQEELDPYLEIAEVHRRIYQKQGPAILFENVKGSPFRALSNLYGTIDRTEFLFRDSLRQVEKVIALKADPTLVLKSFLKYASVPLTALNALPRRQRFHIPVLYGKTTIGQLPQIVSWPKDGGAFVTLPQVLTLGPEESKMMQSNVGMYRIQLSGNQYSQNREVGMHYQLHRGIGVHHTAYLASEKPFKASIFIGGLPAHAFSAIMPMPEGLSELTFAGMLSGRRFRYALHEGHVISADADFVITGEILKNVNKPEGPFGDHLGYYSLQHDFPVMRVENVYHRKDPIWHFTVVGRPPQEDSSFGHLIHKLVGPLTPKEFPGLVELNAVDAAGVHPLLLAIGKERYMPFREPIPEEILTIANHLLGKGQTTLAKYLIIAASDDHPGLNTHDIPAFLKHVLERVNFNRDLHFQTQTTIDTLDYSGSGWNTGSKLVIAARGNQIRQLATEIPADLSVPPAFKNPKIALPGIVIMETTAFNGYADAGRHIETLLAALSHQDLNALPLFVICDDSNFASETLNNFLWVAFTRSNPSHDIYGVGSQVVFKHWGCTGPLIVDARIKPHHAPVLETDPVVSAKVDRMFKKGGVLEKWG